MNNFGIPNGAYYGGYRPSNVAPDINMTQGLTQEELDSLRKTGGGFTTRVSDEELKRSFCAHRTAKNFTVETDDEGNYTCALCGVKFKPFTGSTEEATELVNKVNDLIETAKLQAIKLSPQTIREYFQIQPLLKRLPQLYDMSKRDFVNSLSFNDPYNYGYENNGFNAYYNMVTMGNGFYDPAMMGYQPPMGQMNYQPPMGQGYQQPMGQQMNYQPPMGQGYQQPMGQQMPQGQMNYQQPMGQVANQENAFHKDEVTVNKTLSE